MTIYLLNIITNITINNITINKSNIKLYNNRSCNGLVISFSNGLLIILGSGLGILSRCGSACWEFLIASFILICLIKVSPIPIPTLVPAAVTPATAPVTITRWAGGNPAVLLKAVAAAVPAAAPTPILPTTFSVAILTTPFRFLIPSSTNSLLIYYFYSLEDIFSINNIFYFSKTL